MGAPLCRHHDIVKSTFVVPSCPILSKRIHGRQGTCGTCCIRCCLCVCFPARSRRRLVQNTSTILNRSSCKAWNTYSCSKTQNIKRLNLIFHRCVAGLPNSNKLCPPCASALHTKARVVSIEHRTGSFVRRFL